MRIPFLVGPRVTLGVLSDRGDISRYARWVNNQKTTRYLATGALPTSPKALRAYIARYNRSQSEILLGIFVTRTKRHIGNITLRDIDWRDRRGEIGILIGEPKSRGRGYATEALQLLVEHAFRRLNLNKICCGMIKENEASRRAFLSNGFRVEGLMRQHFFVDGSYRDCYRLGLRRGEFYRSQAMVRPGGKK